jgi:hypothetical protein
MDETQLRERFDTGLKKIREDVKGRLVLHGLFGTVTCVDSGPTGHAPDDSRIEIVAKGKTVGRSFERKQIEGCYLRVSGDVLAGIVAMVDELSA